jgi:hypothetical protein
VAAALALLATARLATAVVVDRRTVPTRRFLVRFQHGQVAAEEAQEDPPISGALGSFA